MSRPHLIALSYSPWSQRAKWALDHHEIDYDYTQYTPMLGEPWLRWKAGQWSGKVTVPTMVTDTGVLTDSLDIARWAEERGAAAPLFGGDLTAIRTWNERTNALLAAGRMLVTAAVASDDAAIMESVPPALRKLPGCVLVGRMGARYLLRKYAMSGSKDDLYAEMRGHLSDAREALGEGPWIQDEFGYADIVLATSFQMLRPPDKGFSLGDASRRAWTLPVLAEEFEDLLEWRDTVLARQPSRRK